MLIKKVLRLNMISVLFFLIISWITFNPSVSSAEITVSSYCQLTIQSMQQEISHYQERIALVNQYGYDPDILAQQLAGSSLVSCIFETKLIKSPHGKTLKNRI